MNKYEVLGIVGEGAYGVVLKCRNRVRSLLGTGTRLAVLAPQRPSCCAGAKPS